jgi:hypothetical protein
MKYKRKENEPPHSVTKKGWRYHHVGIPTDMVMPDEKHLPQYGLHVSGFSTSFYGVEWMRFDKDCHLPKIIRTVPHVAFEVDDIDEAIVGKQVYFLPDLRLTESGLQ